MEVLAPVLLAATLAAAAPSTPEIEPDPSVVDMPAVRRGLEARVGERVQAWGLRVTETGVEREVEVELVRPDGTQETRRMSVSGETTDDRSRELAASLALIIDQYTPPPTPAPERPRVRRVFVGIGPRIGVGRPPDADVGGSLVAGAWLAGEHVMPRISGSWSGSWDGSLLFHGVRFGAGLGAGAPLLAGRLWLGGFLQPQAAWVQARDVFEVERWVFAPEAGGLLQLRLEHLVIGLRTGLDLALPPLRANGRDGASVHWGTFRYMAGLTVGPRF